jgi:hypothetical protein
MLYFKGHLDEKNQNVRFEKALMMLKNVQCVINQFLTNRLLSQ